MAIYNIGDVMRRAHRFLPQISKWFIIDLENDDLLSDMPDRALLIAVHRQLVLDVVDQKINKGIHVICTRNSGIIGLSGPVNQAASVLAGRSYVRTRMRGSAIWRAILP